jgi:DNA-binding transcriptional regulator YhcF (GntR family)
MYPIRRLLKGINPRMINRKPIYSLIQQMLDDAIAENQLEPGNLTPGADDFSYTVGIWQNGKNSPTL